jgi:hypothetical protein
MIYKQLLKNFIDPGKHASSPKKASWMEYCNEILSNIGIRWSFITKSKND